MSDPVLAPLRHGAWAGDVPDAVEERLEDPALPDYVRLPVFRPAAAIVMRRVEQAERVGKWIEGLSPEAQTTPARAGSSSPAEIARHMDEAALRGLASLGLTPSAMAKFGRMLEERQRPDLAQLAAQAQLEGWAEENEGA